MSATYFPYYPQPQYAVPPFYGSQLQGAQEIHSSSVRPHSDLPGSQLQENSHSSSSSTGSKKKNRWTDTEEKILVELFGENEDKLSLAFAESLFFKSKGKKKKPLASTPVPKRREADLETNLPRKRAADAAERPSKKGTKKKGKAGSSEVDEPTLISFLESSQERDEAFMERMAEAEREYRKDQQKFSMDALAMLGNILKDVSKGNE